MCLLRNHIQSYTHFDDVVNAETYAFIQKPAFLPNYLGAPSGPPLVLCLKAHTARYATVSVPFFGDTWIRNFERLSVQNCVQLRYAPRRLYVPKLLSQKTA